MPRRRQQRGILFNSESVDGGRDPPPPLLRSPAGEPHHRGSQRALLTPRGAKRPSSDDVIRSCTRGTYDERRLRMKIVSMLGAAFALALPLLFASRPAAAANVNPIALAVGDN